MVDFDAIIPSSSHRQKQVATPVNPLKKRGKKRKVASSVARRASGDKNRIINDHAIHSSNVTCSYSPFVFNNIKFNQSTVCVHKN